MVQHLFAARWFRQSAFNRFAADAPDPPFGAAVACRNDRYAAQNQAICADGRRACLLVELRLMVGV
jgi:hypothetical protein